MRFRNVHAALRFAFNDHSTIEQSAVFRMRPDRDRRPSSSQEPLSPLERAAQAGMIRAAVARLPEPRQSAIVATYGRGPERLAAYWGLAQGLPGRDPAYARALVALVLNSRRVTIGAVVERTGVPAATVQVDEAAVRSEIADLVHAGAQALVEPLEGLLDGD